jgi:hypothetical protein
VTEKPKKTVVVPDEFEPAKAEPVFPMAAFVLWDGHDGRDVSQPICLDANGEPLYAPRGLQTDHL